MMGLKCRGFCRSQKTLIKTSQTQKSCWPQLPVSFGGPKTQQGPTVNSIIHYNWHVVVGHMWLVWYRLQHQLCSNFLRSDSSPVHLCCCSVSVIPGSYISICHSPLHPHSLTDHWSHWCCWLRPVVFLVPLRTEVMCLPWRFPAVPWEQWLRAGITSAPSDNGTAARINSSGIGVADKTESGPVAAVTKPVTFMVRR